MFRPIQIQRYVAFMQSRGVASGSVLQGSGITYEDLLDPNFLVDLDQSQSVVANLLRLSGDQGIAFEMVNDTKLTDLGLLAYTMISSGTTYDAAVVWQKYSSPLVGILVEHPALSSLQSCDGKRDDFPMSLTAMAPLGSVSRFCIEEVLIILKKLGGELINEPLVASRLELSYPSPPHRALYDEFFNCPIRFDAPQTRITFKLSFDIPLRSKNAEVNAICLRQCNQITRQVTSGAPVIARLRSLLMRNPELTATVDELARELGMSSRTLQRHLQTKGTNYRKLVNELRADLVGDYLRSGRMTQKEVGYTLGFEDTNSFRRAFKSWTGQTIQEYLASVTTP